MTSVDPMVDGYFADPEQLETTIKDLNARVVDVKYHEYWLNKRDTLIMAVPASKAFYFAEYLHLLNPDEFQWSRIDGHVIVRLWWD